MCTPFLFIAGHVLAQNGAGEQRAAIEAAMARSLAVQRQSVAAQAGSAIAQSDAGSQFFTLSWPKPAGVQAAGCDPLQESEIERLIEENARREGLKPDVLRAVMRRESAFRPCAVSRKGAQGLMQLMPATAEQFGVADPFDPAQNVAAGARFLRLLLDRYSGDVALALSAYNAGPGRVDQANGIPDIPETRNYVGAIMRSILLQ